MKLVRYDPRKDRDALADLAVKFCEWRGLEFDREKFLKEIDTRVRDLKLRNSIVLAKDQEGNLIGAGMFSLYNDHFGNTNCIVHHVMTSKEDAFKKGIEEAIFRELFKYLKNIMNIKKIGLFCEDKHSQMRSLLMKLGIKKSEKIFYEHTL